MAPAGCCSSNLSFASSVEFIKDQHLVELSHLVRNPDPRYPISNSQSSTLPHYNLLPFCYTSDASPALTLHRDRRIRSHPQPTDRHATLRPSRVHSQAQRQFRDLEVRLVSARDLRGHGVRVLQECHLQAMLLERVRAVVRWMD